MTTDVRHQSSRESVSIQPLLPRTNRQLSESRICKPLYPFIAWFKI